MISISIHNNFDENLSFKQEEIIELCTKVLDAENCDDAKIDLRSIVSEYGVANSAGKDLKLWKQDNISDHTPFIHDYQNP